MEPIFCKLKHSLAFAQPIFVQGLSSPTPQSMSARGHKDVKISALLETDEETQRFDRDSWAKTDHRKQQKLWLPAFLFACMKGEKHLAQHNPFRGPAAVPLAALVSMMLQCRSSMPGPARPSSSPTLDFPPLYPT